MNVFEKIKSLNLPSDQYVVVGGSVLAAHGIRHTEDIDIVATQHLFDQLKNQGWQEGKKPNGGAALYKDVFEVYLDVNCDSYQPTTEELMNRADDIQGIPFISLDDLLQFKKGYSRAKDKSDIELIEKRLAK